jgi:exo-beta-1,3-glucanase (GH17 family)/cellulose synthase/poly-beta-1,6-N-acetylglucosamine synthase-like glycosyltransferase
MRVVAFVGVVVACVHAGAWALSKNTVSAPDFTTQIASLSYTPFDGSAHPNSGTRTSAAQIRADLQAIAPYTRKVRTYSSTGGSEQVPEIAREFGLKVSLGAWLDKNAERNEREIRAVIDLARKYRNIDSIVVGNETVYRGEQIPLQNLNLSADESESLLREEARRINEARTPNDRKWSIDENNVRRLIKLIQRVKRETGLTVTTGEIHSVWSYHPSLASGVDFIAAHVLPYWEGISATAAVDQAVLIHHDLRQSYPGKQVVIAEFGWPSAGYNRHDANPGQAEQATVLRDFIARADALGIDYNIIEAYDQPWKTFEGGVGPYWGMFNTSREPKFALVGAITDPDHWKLMAIAVLIGVLLSLPILSLAGVTGLQVTLLTGAAHAVGAWFAIVFAYWNGHYFVTGAAIALGVGLVLLVPLILVALTRIEEIAAAAFGKKPSRLIASPPLASEIPSAPKVSIHIPAYKEPPEMLKLTLDAVARLDYPNFECVLVINNTPDPALWRPVEEHCRTLGARFKFVREDNLAGYKAGALRLALTHTADDAEIIGVLDADYVVNSDWLKDLVPIFADPKVGLLQAPQDHRDGDRSPMHHAMNGEYAGFFDIGMVQRNEANAIIVHGTMCLVRRTALEAAGNWSSDTICEDTDLGLTILELGWQSHYTNRRYGHGLLPESYLAYKRQRDRWAYGGFQIVKKHWRRFLPGRSLLTREQKRTFALGWLSWLGAESIGVLVALLNLAWVPFVAVLGIAIPDKVLTLPILAAFLVSIAHFVSLYRLRVAIPRGQMLGAVFAAMSVQWTVARAVGLGLIKDGLPFIRTAKGGSGRRRTDFPAFWEAVLGGLLVASAIFLHLTNWERVREIDLYAAVLAIQAIPFLAAVGLAILEGLPINDFAFWRGLETKLSALRVPRRVTPEVPAMAERTLETAQ